MALVTIAALAEFLNFDDNDARATSDLLQEHLDTAHQRTEYIVETLEEDDQTYVVHQPGPALVLPARQLQALVSVTDADGRVIPAESVTANLRAGVLTLDVDGRPPWTVVVTPRERKASIALAVKIIAANLWETQRGRTGGDRRGGFNPVAEETVTLRGFAIPRRAAEILQPYMGLAN